MKCKFLTVLLCSAWAMLCPILILKAQEPASSDNFYLQKARFLAEIFRQDSINLLNGEGNTDKEDGDLSRFHRWEWLWRNRLGANGDMSTASKVMAQYLKVGRGTNCDSPYDNDINWTNLGPFNSQGSLGTSSYSCHSASNKQNQGRLECISVNPQNTDEILVGGWNSGVWKTTDGGATWTNTTDDEGFSYVGICSMVRHPKNSNIIYAATGTDGKLWDNARSIYGVGIIMSEDGGISWRSTGHINNPGPWTAWNSRNYKIAIDPNSTLAKTILYTNTRTQIFKWEGSHLANGSWTSVYVDGSDGKGPLWWEYVNHRDIEVASDGTAWFSNYTGLFSVAPNSNTATKATYTLPTNFQNLTACANSNPTQSLRQDINIEINNQGHIVFLVTLTKCNPRLKENHIYTSKDNGVTWTSKRFNLITREENHFTIHPTNSMVIYAEEGDDNFTWGRCMHKSIDGGTTFSLMQGRENHPDVRHIVAINGTENPILFVANDGGISKCTNQQDWVDINGTGLSITNYYGIGITETNDKMIFAGAQDGNINYYNNGKWYQTNPDGDNGDCLITEGNRTIIQESQGSVNVGALTSNNTATTYFHSVGTWMNPLCLNPNNSIEFFIGVQALQRTVTNSGTINEIYDASMHTRTDISSVTMSRQNSKVVYYSLAQSGTNGGIFKATQTGSTWANFTITNISNNLPKDNPITDIAADPNNENRIWVTFAGFDDPNHAFKRVFKTENSGTTWENVSGCLQNFPVLSICYQEGSNDRLYIGTDIGVFYRDNLQTEWARYGNGGTPCMVSDMEINQCAGKLVVATYGRGLWEAPLLTNVATEIATGSTTWNRNRTVASDIRVKKGATLKIEGTVAVPTVIGFGRGVRIIVEDGAKLEVTNATLTNACGYMWQGIEAWGDATATQIPKLNTPNKQSIIQLTNATIEYSNNAITTWKVGDLTTTGAIIKATNSKFINNTRSVEYMKYKGRTPLGNPLANIGRFTNCTFTVDNGYRRGNDFKYHVSMWAVDGIGFLGCTFKSERDFPFHNEQNSGIRSLDASFNIDANCGTLFPCGTKTGRNSFNGFNKGIYSSSSQGLSFISVVRSDFSNNAMGIHSENNYLLTSLENSFVIGNPAITVSPNNIHEGIITMSSSALNVAQNKFSPRFSEAFPATVGVRTRGNLGNDNTIYKNTFEKSDIKNSNGFHANLANGTNNANNNGLKYKCNKNINNVINGFDFAVTDAGIALDQGSLAEPAGNTFSLGLVKNAPVGSDFHNSSTSDINYFHALTPTIEDPKNIFTIKKTVAKGTSFCPNVYDSDEEFPFAPIDTTENSTEKIQAAIRQVIKNKDSLNVALLRFWLKKANTLESYYGIVETYLHEGNAELALQTLDMIPLRFIFDAVGAQEFEYYVKLKSMQAMWLQNGLTIFDLSSNDISTLKIIATQSESRAGDAARGLLNFAYNSSYFIPPVLPEVIGGRTENASERAENTTKLSESNATLVAYPNPASHIVNFEYHTLDKTLNGESELIIQNPLGQVVKRFKMTSDGLISWNIESLNTGIYTFSLELDGKIIIPAQQLVIAR